MFWTRYVAVFSAASTMLLGMVIAINIVIDPYDVTGMLYLDGINKLKPLAQTHSRLYKAYAVRRTMPRGLVLGSSRAEHGIDPEHKGWALSAHPVFNLSLSGINIDEVYAYLRHAHAVTPLVQVVIGLDFFWFDPRHRETNDFDSDALEDGSVSKRVSSAFYPPRISASFDVLRDSFRTTRLQSGEPGFFTNGRTTEALFNKMLIEAGGYDRLAASTLRRYFRTSRARNGAPDQQPLTLGIEASLKRFREILDFARLSKIDLVLYISPSHAWDMEATRAIGLWSEFEQWKRGVVRDVEREGAVAGLPAYQLWDFSGYNGVTSEEVPTSGKFTRWYWEPSHFKREVGDMVLDTIFETRSRQLVAPADFGVRLHSAMLEKHLARIREQRESWVHTHRLETEIIERIAEETGFQQPKNHAATIKLDTPWPSKPRSSATTDMATICGSTAVRLTSSVEEKFAYLTGSYH